MLNIVGASARAAAFSARAVGFQPSCADLFADVDLQAVCAAKRIENYPEDLAGWLHSAPHAPWMYTGALENYPDQIDELARLRPLYGNSGRALRSSRDPLFWSRALAEAGIPAPRVSLSSAELPRDGSWMRKPLRSANGQNVSPWLEQLSERGDEPSDVRGWYYQERVSGIPVAAVFVAADGDASILGVTRQLLGGDWRKAVESAGASGEDESPTASKPWASARRLIGAEELDELPFRYTGSIGPHLLSDEHFGMFERIGKVLAHACGLTGLFGVDAILNAQGVWPVEINPRYTASVEVLERASALRTSGRRPRRLNSIEWHEAACLFRRLPAALGQSDETTSGKLIYYAPRDVTFASNAARWAVERNLALTRPAVADLPAAGATIRHGHPVLTLLADGTSASSVFAELTSAVAELEARLVPA
jgi:predicted ATP-grasp superfamily ATP-dependent carboligase